MSVRSNNGDKKITYKIGPGSSPHYILQWINWSHLNVYKKSICEPLFISILKLDFVLDHYYFHTVPTKIFVQSCVSSLSRSLRVRIQALPLCFQFNWFHKQKCLVKNVVFVSKVLLKDCFICTCALNNWTAVWWLNLMHLCVHAQPYVLDKAQGATHMAINHHGNYQGDE